MEGLTSRIAQEKNGKRSAWGRRSPFFDQSRIG
jgi:hypothetical protein